MPSERKSVLVNLTFEKTQLPPFEDILILGIDCPLGMNGVGKCLDLLVPDGFSYHVVEDSHVAAVVINKNITKRVTEQEVVDILRNKVFPYVGRSELIKVTFNTTISYDGISIGSI